MNETAPRRAPDAGKLLASLIDSLGVQRYTGHVILLIVAAGVIWLGRANVLSRVPTRVDVSALVPMGEAVPTPASIIPSVAIAPVAAASGSGELTRLTELHTYIPDRPRQEIANYNVHNGDTILGIAEKFGLKPETIVFGNPILRDNPHFLEPGQTLRIAPIDGIIRDVIAGDTIGGLARAYGVKPEVIVTWPANNIDPDNPQITVGQVLFVPGGSRGLLSFPTQGDPKPGSGTSGGSGGSGGQVSTPKEPWVLKSGSGQCANGLAGGVAGSGAFIWPGNQHWVSGYDYSGIHTGIDLDGDSGEPAYASDSGVVVFSGWSDWGYGSTVIIAHGNNWWTLYGHLSAIYVSCGQGVYQGSQIGAMGNTGKSQGSHLHFEIYYGAYTTNPWGVLPPP